MGKMTFDISCEIGISLEDVKQLNKNDYFQSEYVRDTEEKVKIYLKDFGEILEFKNELVDKTKYKFFCKIRVLPELIIQFEKWGQWEFTRLMDRELRLSLNGLGEILDFQNDLDYTLDEYTPDENSASENGQNEPVKTKRMKFLKIIVLLLIFGSVFVTIAYQARYGKIEHNLWGAYHG